MPADFDLHTADLRQLTAALRDRSLGAVELMQQTLDGLQHDADRLRTFVARVPPDELLAQARAAQARLHRGEARPLEGIPLGVKDLEDVAGMVTTHGSKLLASHHATQDSVQVERLREAGAIVVGKTNTSEFGHTASTRNLLFGATHSPWDPVRSPGGSSGGAAASLAASIVPLVTASDGAGSVRVPASMCGVFGFKPTHGRIPGGPGPLWDSSAVSTHGLINKTVADAAMVLDIVAGPDPRDPFSLPPTASFHAALEQPIDRPLRIGFSPDFGHIPVQADVAAAVEQGLAELTGLGHGVEPIAGGPPDLALLWGILLGQHLGRWIGDAIEADKASVTRRVVALVEHAATVSAQQWGEHQRQRMQTVVWFADVFSRVDVIVTPTAPYEPPPAKGPPPTEIAGRALPMSNVAAFTMPANFAWLPAASVPVGFSEAGLPVGLQIIGPRGDDARVLRVAAALEAARPWPGPPVVTT